jgi:amidohydrolase family protein
MVSSTPAPNALREATGLRAVDVDLHHQIASWEAVAPFAPSGLRWRFSRKGGPPLARHGFWKIGARFGEVPMPPAGHPAADPSWVKEQVLEPRGIDVAILTGQMLSLGVQPGMDLASAIARKEPPHAYILRHFYSTTYPLEAAPPRHLHQTLEMIEAERTLLFATNYPNWEFGDPAAMIADLPESLRRRVMVENALAVYGDRLLAPSRRG